MNENLLRQLIRESIYKKILLEININSNERQFLRAKEKKDTDKIKSIYAKLVAVDASKLNDTRSQKLEKLKKDIENFLDKNTGQNNQKATKQNQTAQQSIQPGTDQESQDQTSQNKNQKTKTAPKKSNSKVAKLQKIIGEEPADGVWKESTNKAWKAWITSERTFKAIQKTATKIKDALTKEFLGDNKGKAATIARAAGKAGNISGVLELAELINFYIGVNKDQSDRDYEKEADKKSAEQVEESATGAWANKRIKNRNDFYEKYGKDKYSQAGIDTDAIKCKIGTIIKDEGVPLSLVFNYKEFVRHKKIKSFRDLVQISTVSPTGYWFDALAAGHENSRVISKMISFDDENISFPGNGIKTTGTNVLYYNENTKTLLYDTPTGDYILYGARIKGDRIVVEQ